jgi:subtilisin family serine protease
MINKHLLKYFCFVLNVLFLLSTGNIYSQKTYFIRYKSNVQIDEVSSYARKKEIFATSSLLQKSTQLLQNVAVLSDCIKTTDAILSRILIVKLKQDIDSVTFKSILANSSDIEYVQAGHIYKVDFTPNDSLFSQQWALAKIDAQDAWNITMGEDTVVVGVIDTGIDYLHPDLKNKIYINPGETGLDAQGHDKRFNGIDDDGDGFVDDYMGWDFVNRYGFPYDSTGGDYLNWDNDPMDEHSLSHGTAVAGVIGAETNNAIGISGVAPKVKLLNCRAFDPQGNGEESDVASAILYAVKMGAKVINMSFGDTSFSFVLRDVIRYAYEKNIVLVASSGNDGTDIEHYPSGYDEVISVGNSTREDYVDASSSFGSRLDLVAPGTDILSTQKNASYGSLSGTSFSAPHVSGTAALIRSKGNFTNDEVKQILKSTADDIDAAGWDIHSGSGRLNAYRALKVLAPAVVKFDYPEHDYATKSDTLAIYATIMSPYFKNYEFSYGPGLTPDTFYPMLQNQVSQVSNKLIYNLDLSALPDTTLTLRILLNQTNGSTLEERINVHHIKTLPKILYYSLFPVYYGDKPTIGAEAYISQKGLVKLFFREKGTKDFNFVSLDGLTVNNNYVQNAHYGFIPLEMVHPDKTYEMYFEIENLQGGKSVIIDTTGNYFVITTDGYFAQRKYTEMSYSLDAGSLFSRPLPITSNDTTDILFNKNGDLTKTFIYSFSHNAFTLRDSLSQRITKDAGDFNKDGKLDLLTNWSRNGYILEQNAVNSTDFNEITKKETDSFWPVFAKDIANSGNMDVLALTDDSTLSVFRLRSNLVMDSLVSVKNFSPVGYGGNVFDYPNALLIDADKDGKNEIWTIDSDGDVLCYNVISETNIQPDFERSFSTGMVSSSSYITSGDFDNDGITDIAIVLHSPGSVTFGSYLRVLVFNYKGGSLNILCDKSFIDPSGEYSRFAQRSYNSIKLANVDGEKGDELLLFTFPYAYIIKNSSGVNKFISYHENINTSSVFVGDLNKDGVPEIALPQANKVTFIQFDANNSMIAPAGVSGFSLDSSQVALNWVSDYSKFYIYRGTTSQNLTLIDSTTGLSYYDKTPNLKNTYYYGIQSVQSGAQSGFSKIISVYHHAPAVVKSFAVNTWKSVKVDFSEQISSAVFNYKVFYIKNASGVITYPEAVTASSQYSYLISFPKSDTISSYTFYVSGLVDLYSSPVQADSFKIAFPQSSAVSNFFVENFEIIDPYNLAVKFNMPVDQNSFLNKAHYIFNPSNAISNITFDELNPSKVYLSFRGNKPIGSVGIDYTLHFVNVTSSGATGSVAINQGAGSTIILSDFAADLSKVYVYPNPVTHSNGNSKVTFANLPEFAKILVLNLQGEKIIELDEKDGNGGISWDLRDSGGRYIPTGVYLYRVTQLNSNNQEISTRLLKFVVIR